MSNRDGWCWTSVDEKKESEETEQTEARLIFQIEYKRLHKEKKKTKHGKQPSLYTQSSGKKFCVQTLHTRQKRLDAQDATRQDILYPDNTYQRTYCTERDPPIVTPERFIAKYVA